MKQVEIYRAANIHEAQVLKNVLEHEGICAFISNEGLLGATDMVGWSIEPKVMVSESDVNAALSIVDQFVQQVRTRRELRIDEADAELSESERDWPLCPMCHEPRIAMCTGCGSVGTDFGEAVFVETDSGLETDREVEFEIEPEEGLLMCTVCDVPFQPAYRKICKCNYEFADGIDFDRNPTSSKSSPLIVLILITILAAIAIGCLYLLNISLV